MARSRNTALDGFRGIGCIMVLIGHTQWQGSTILPGGVIAMDIFFSLSGFLITGLLFSEINKTGSIDFLKFWKRRALRLLPTFYAYFFIGLTVYLLAGLQPMVGTDSWVTFLSTGFYASNWAVANGYDLGMFTVTWSLSVEEQFYLVCPFVLLFLHSKLKKIWIPVVIVFLIIAVNLHRSHLFDTLLASDGLTAAWKRCFYGTETRMDSFLCGGLCAVLYSAMQGKVKIPNFIGTSAFIVMMSATLIDDLPIAAHLDENSFYTEFLMKGGFTFYSLLGGTICMYLVQSPNSLLGRFLSQRHLVFVGLMSYSLYLWHTAIFGGLELLLKDWNSSPVLWTAKTALRFSTAFFVAYISYRFTELPMERLRQKSKKFDALNREKSLKDSSTSISPSKKKAHI